MRNDKIIRIFKKNCVQVDIFSGKIKGMVGERDRDRESEAERHRETEKST